MNASGATSITPRSRCWRDALGLEHVVERVEQRAQVRVDLRHQVAGEEAEPLAGLDRRAGEDDPVDLAPAERGRGERHRQERLARAGRPDPERDRVVADRVDVALLVDGLGRDLGGAVAPDDVLEDPAPATRARRAPGSPPRSCPGAISWPCAISSESSRTTAAAASTASASPSSVSTLPRRKTSQSRWPRAPAARRPRCRRARSRPRCRARAACAPRSRYAPSASRTRADARLPSARPPALRHHDLHHLAHVLRARWRRSPRSRRRRSRRARRRRARRGGSPRSAPPRTPPGRRAPAGRRRGTGSAASSRRLRSRRSTASSSSAPSLAAF